MALNAGRGSQVIDEDLIKALGRWHIADATLDVFHTAPLASDHPFWAHPKVNDIPHASSISTVRSGAPQMAENIRRARRGQSFLNVVDREAGTDAGKAARGEAGSDSVAISPQGRKP